MKVRAQTLIQDLWKEVENEPDAIVQIETADYKVYDLRFIPVRYAPNGTPIITLRTTIRDYETGE